MLAKEYRDVAKHVARVIRAAHEGPVDDNAAWIETSRRLGCRVAYHNRADLPKGQYAHLGMSAGYMFLYRGSTPWTLRRVIIHELAHHVQMSEVTFSLFGNTVFCYHDDALDIRDEISQEVERIILDEDADKLAEAVRQLTMTPDELAKLDREALRRGAQGRPRGPKPRG